jgi:hypothetical protein
VEIEVSDLKKRHAKCDDREFFALNFSVCTCFIASFVRYMIITQWVLVFVCPTVMINGAKLKVISRCVPGHFQSQSTAPVKCRCFTKTVS